MLVVHLLEVPSFLTSICKSVCSNVLKMLKFLGNIWQCQVRLASFQGLEGSFVLIDILNNGRLCGQCWWSLEAALSCSGTRLPQGQTLLTGSECLELCSLLWSGCLSTFIKSSLWKMTIAWLSAGAHAHGLCSHHISHAFRERSHFPCATKSKWLKITEFRRNYP